MIYCTYDPPTAHAEYIAERRGKLLRRDVTRQARRIARADGGGAALNPTGAPLLYNRAFGDPAPFAPKVLRITARARDGSPRTPVDAPISLTEACAVHISANGDVTFRCRRIVALLMRACTVAAAVLATVCVALSVTTKRTSRAWIATSAALGGVTLSLVAFELHWLARVRALRHLTAERAQ